MAICESDGGSEHFAFLFSLPFDRLLLVLGATMDAAPGTDSTLRDGANAACFASIVSFVVDSPPLAGIFDSTGAYSTGVVLGAWT